MSVAVTNTTRQRLSKAVIEKAVEATLLYCRQKGDVSVVIIGDSRMKQLNKMYRGKDAVTDVLSFTEAEAQTAAKDFLGEIFVDYEVIKKQAKKFSPSIRYELAFIVIHGTLHLLGYDDVTEKGADTMEAMGNAIIKKIL
jgi:probable rRNA maturation factor